MTIDDLKQLRDEFRSHLPMTEPYAPLKVTARLKLAIEAMDALIRERTDDLSRLTRG